MPISKNNNKLKKALREGNMANSTKKIQTSQINQTSEKLVGVSFEIGRWTGQVRVEETNRKNHFKVLELYPLNGLKFFYKVRYRAVDNWLDTYGIRYMSTWIIPESLVDSTHNLFNDLKEEFFEGVSKFSEDYEMRKIIWQKKEPFWAHLINEPRYNVENLIKKFYFEWYFYQLIPTKTNSVIQKTFSDKMDKIDGAIYEDVAKMAHKLWEKTFSWRESVTPRVIGPIKVIKDKIQGFSFINPTFDATVLLISRAIQGPPMKAKDLIPEKQHMLMKNLIYLLKNSELALKGSQRVLDGADPYEVLSNFVPQHFGKEETTLILGTH